VTAEDDDAPGAEQVGGEDGAEAHSAITDDGDGVARFDCGREGGVIAGAHDVGEGQERGQDFIGERGAGHGDEGAVGQGDPGAFGLAGDSFNALAEEASSDAGGVEAGPAVGTGTIAGGKGGDDEFAALDGLDFGADFFDEADEFVADGAFGMGRDAALIPEVGAADAGPDDADDGVRRLLNDWIGSLFYDNVTSATEDGCFHVYFSSRC
jgi:hypothetical protein